MLCPALFLGAMLPMRSGQKGERKIAGPSAAFRARPEFRTRTSETARHSAQDDELCFCGVGAVSLRRHFLRGSDSTHFAQAKNDPPREHAPLRVAAGALPCCADEMAGIVAGAGLDAALSMLLATAVTS